MIHIYSVLYIVESMLAQVAAALSCLVLPPAGDWTGDVISDVTGSLSSESSSDLMDWAVDCTCNNIA